MSNAYTWRASVLASALCSHIHVFFRFLVFVWFCVAAADRGLCSSCRRQDITLPWIFLCCELLCFVRTI